MLWGEGVACFCVCAFGASDGYVPASAAARTTSVVRAGGVSDGSRPSLRRAARTTSFYRSNLQRCRVRPSEQLRAQSLAQSFVWAHSICVWSSFGCHSPLMRPQRVSSGETETLAVVMASRRGGLIGARRRSATQMSTTRPLSAPYSNSIILLGFPSGIIELDLQSSHQGEK